MTSSVPWWNWNYQNPNMMPAQGGPPVDPTQGQGTTGFPWTASPWTPYGGFHGFGQPSAGAPGGFAVGGGMQAPSMAPPRGGDIDPTAGGGMDPNFRRAQPWLNPQPMNPQMPQAGLQNRFAVPQHFAFPSLHSLL